MFKLTHHALVLLATAALMPLSLAAAPDKDPENSPTSVPTQKPTLSFLTELNNKLKKAPEKKETAEEDETPKLKHMTNKRPKGPSRRPQSREARTKALEKTEAAEKTETSAESK